MTIPDILEQNQIIPDGQQQKAGSASRHGGLSARLSITVLLWVVLDYVCALASGLIAFRIRQHARIAPLYHGFLNHQFWLSLPLISVVYVVLFGLYLIAFARVYGLYRAADHSSGLNEQRMTVQAVLTAGLLLCGTLYVMRAYAVSRIVVALTLVLTMSAMMVRRFVWRKVRERRFLDGRDVRNVLIVGEGRVADALREHLQSLPYMGFRFKGFVSVEGGGHGTEVVSDVENCVAVARSLFVDEIYFTAAVAKETVVAVVEEAHENGIDVRIVPDMYDGLAWNAPVEYVGQFPTIPLHMRDFPRGAFVLKRMMDVIFALIALILCSPVMLVVALLIKTESDGPILYAAKRVGRKGRTFSCYKFRTMVNKADKLKASLEHRNERDGILFKITDDPRITATGAWLRKFSLDELPQFFNVLLGDMSIVGPRPPLSSEVAKYDIAHLRRLDVLPGITGLWQVQARQNPSFDQYISLDTAYVENWSLLLDLQIMLRTVGVIVSGTGS
ncbi:sugar transferase [Granulicella paludicola]|jgi:exopolysaccharide biosynthesis polyprenyl glycosylphosphotransferase|uniref:sugar transferase n=1 Tax=Granulicella paludicola TaxID=474951 RepID=UPI0021E06DE5|nr:sugar transferase [Granulicella paludicola]